MEDYHEFKRVHALEIEMWRMYWCPDYVSMTSGRLPSDYLMRRSRDVPEVPEVLTPPRLRPISQGPSPVVSPHQARSRSPSVEGEAIGPPTATEAAAADVRAAERVARAEARVAETELRAAHDLLRAAGYVVADATPLAIRPPQTRGQVPLFDPLAEFFESLRVYYQGVRTDKLQSLQTFSRKAGESLREAYTRMRRLIATTQGVTKAQAV